MYEEKDVYIKDEGDFATVCFMSNKAQSIIRSDYDVVKHLRIGKAVGGGETVKLDIEIDSIHMMIDWCKLHDLTVENEF
ncbi:MAG TPA: hypothetical protein VK172_10535 [Lentimicrobium sp.]|nr:hypothetical protein [Lentimicrobium sp.]